MATRTRGGAASTSTPAKEKRGASPSNTTRKITPSSSTKTNSPAKNHGPTSSGKNVPHYLKSTASSGPDKPQLGEKPVVEASSSKATLNRRRSLDKPQPPPQTQRLRVPPNASLRSSSFSGKSSVSSQHQKTGADKGVMRGTKDGAGKQQQQHGLYARSSTGSSSNVKKSTTAVYVKKQVSTSSGGGSSMKKEEVVISPVEKIEDHAEQVLSDHDAEAEVEQDHVHEALTAEKVEDGNNEVEDLENEKTMIAADDHRTEVSDQSDDKDAKIVEAESSAVVEHKHDNDDEHVAVKNEEAAEEKSHVEEVVITTNQEDAKEEIIDEVRNDEIVAGDDNLIENVVEAKNEKDKEEEESIEAGNVSDAHEAAKETIVKEVVIEKKPETINLTAKYPGKKDVAVSNDVIEETASKLREQRKNKVKALAGAFETVISLQEPK